MVAQWARGHIAPTLGVQPRRPPRATFTPRTMTVLRRGVRTLLPTVDAVLLCTDGDGSADRVRIAFADLVELLDGSGSWMDETHLLVEAIDGGAWDTLVNAGTRPPSPGPGARDVVLGGWVWVLDQDARYLAFEFNDPARGRTAKGRAVSTPPTASEVLAAVEQPDHTFPTGAGVGNVSRLDIDEIRLLGLPFAPPWA